MIEGASDTSTRLPDSFSCRICISGKGLRDLVLNFQFLFDVSEVETIESGVPDDELTGAEERSGLLINEPAENAPRVCVIDSGIQERHPLLRPALEQSISKSWINSPTDVSDYVRRGGHGTKVAGAVLYPRDIPSTGAVFSICWIQNARVLDQNNIMPVNLFPPKFLQEIVKHFHGEPGRTRIFNHSINASAPSRTRHMSIWAAALDNLVWDNDLLFILSAGNVKRRGLSTMPGIRDYIYPLDVVTRVICGNLLVA
ncbi:S8 family serine peptidase [Desulfofarcimen acetoxidans]|uniref:S8 family serine peptidase n=1 Tax=Desulfofarcimen acetoxidans TaxID=58138 RepID=UPI00019E5807|nr:S8 family serine peptidase [Desulfofarcimen acetoxidans]